MIKDSKLTTLPAFTIIILTELRRKSQEASLPLESKPSQELDSK